MTEEYVEHFEAAFEAACRVCAQRMRDIPQLQYEDFAQTAKCFGLIPHAGVMSDEAEQIVAHLMVSVLTDPGSEYFMGELLAAKRIYMQLVGDNVPLLRWRENLFLIFAKRLPEVVCSGDRY